MYKALELGQVAGVMHGFELAGIWPGQRVFTCAQENAASVVEVADYRDCGVLRADAVFTREQMNVGIVTADCLPILVASRNQSFVAAIHGGWQGLKGGIIANAFARFTSAGVDLDSLVVAIGPAIQSCCYEVSSAFVEDLERLHGRLWADAPAPWRQARNARRDAQLASAEATHGFAWLDLQRYCRYLLREVGLQSSQIEGIDACTYCSSPALGSYRRRTRHGEAKAFQCSWIGRH